MKIEQKQLIEILWAVLPGIIACLAILYPFYLSSGEFIYLDWIGGHGTTWHLDHFFEIYTKDWLSFHAIPWLILQLPFVLLFGYGASSIFSKLFFLSMFGAASTGLYLFFKENKAMYLLAVAILCFSPYVYERTMMGQFGVVYTIMLAPLFLYFTKKYLEEPTKKNAFCSALFMSLSTLMQTHGILLHFVLFGCLIVFYLYFNKGKGKEIVFSLGYFALSYFLLNIYWIIPLLTLENAPIFSAIDSGDINFFQPRPSFTVNTFVKTALQFGAWRENGMLVAYNLIPYPLLLVALFVFIYLSAIGTVEKRTPFSYALALAAIIGFIFALGPVSPLFNFAVDNLPLFSGFRDSNKFVELITLAYAFLIPIGLLELVQKKKNLIFSIIILGIITFNYPAIGLSNQLHPNNIPLEYYQIKYSIPENEKAVYFPIGIYLTYNWSLQSGLDGRIANPIGKEPSENLITLTNPGDFGAEDPRFADLSNCASTSCLLKNNISYVVTDKCAMWISTPDWVKKNADIYNETGCLTVYKLK